MKVEVDKLAVELLREYTFDDSGITTSVNVCNNNIIEVKISTETRSIEFDIFTDNKAINKPKKSQILNTLTK